jgi:hypothetical protein
LGLDVSTSSNQGVSTQKKAAIAEKIAHGVVNSDPSILSMIVLDQKEGNQILAVARSAGLPPEKHASAELVKKFAIAATVVWGAAEIAAQLMGRREFIIGAFKDQLVLLISLQEYQMLLGIRLTRSSNAEHIHAKIAALLGIG